MYVIKNIYFTIFLTIFISFTRSYLLLMNSLSLREGVLCGAVYYFSTYIQLSREDIPIVISPKVMKIIKVCFFLKYIYI